MITVEKPAPASWPGFNPPRCETIGLAVAWNRVTAEPVIARLTQPPSDVSAMDGYALRAADGALGARLRVIGAAPGRPSVRGHGRPRPDGAAVHRQRGARTAPTRS